MCTFCDGRRCPAAQQLAGRKYISALRPDPGICCDAIGAFDQRVATGSARRIGVLRPDPRVHWRAAIASARRIGRGNRVGAFHQCVATGSAHLISALRPDRRVSSARCDRISALYRSVEA
jgi:hypothetical protein